MCDQNIQCALRGLAFEFEQLMRTHDLMPIVLWSNQILGLHKHEGEVNFSYSWTYSGNWVAKLEQAPERWRDYDVVPSSVAQFFHALRNLNDLGKPYFYPYSASSAPIYTQTTTCDFLAPISAYHRELCTVIIP